MRPTEREGDGEGGGSEGGARISAHSIGAARAPGRRHVVSLPLLALAFFGLTRRGIKERRSGAGDLLSPLSDTMHTRCTAI